MTDEELIARLRKDDADFWHAEAADRIEALEAKLAKVVAAADKMLDAFCVHEDSHQSAAYEAMCAALAETEGDKP